MKMTPHKITNCLWFDAQAEEAANFYVSIFDGAKIGRIYRYGTEGGRSTAKLEGHPERCRRPVQTMPPPAALTAGRIAATFAR